VLPQLELEVAREDQIEIPAVRSLALGHRLAHPFLDLLELAGRFADLASDRSAQRFPIHLGGEGWIGLQRLGEDARKVQRPIRRDPHEWRRGEAPLSRLSRSSPAWVNG